MPDNDCFNCDAPLAECACGDSEGYSQDALVCPYCGELNAPADSDGQAYSESMEEYMCGACGKDFECTVHIMHSWTSHRKEA